MNNRVTSFGLFHSKLRDKYANTPMVTWWHKDTDELNEYIEKVEECEAAIEKKIELNACANSQEYGLLVNEIDENVKCLHEFANLCQEVRAAYAKCVDHGL